MAQFRVSVQGVEEVLRRLGRDGAKRLADDLDRIVERETLKMVNDAKHNAPVKSGGLKGSIDIYEEGKLYRVISSDKPYARRQEYEHATKKGYFRKAIWKGRQPFRDAINEQIQRSLGG